MSIPTDLMTEAGLSPGRAAAADRYWLSRMDRRDARPLLRVYALEEPALLLGRYQAPLHPAGDAGPAGLGRRLAGGRAVPAGPGFVGIALYLPRAWDLAGDAGRILPPDLVLNRYVRGVMGACLRFNVKALYMGRDVLTVERKKIGLVGFTLSESGGVFFECHFALSGDLSAPPPGLTRAALPSGVLYPPDPPVTSLATQAGREISLPETSEALARGFESRLGLGCEERLPEAKDEEGIGRLEEEMAEAGWTADRTPRPAETRRAETEIQLGRLSASLSVNADGTIASVTLAGDFLSDDRTLAELEEAFCGKPCEWKALGEATDEVLDRPGRFLLGTGKRRVLPDTLLRAVS